MEIAFIVVCAASGVVLALGIAFAIGKIERVKKMPDWVPSLIGIILAAGGLFGGFWFADAYKQYIIDQAQENQYEQCVELLNS